MVAASGAHQGGGGTMARLPLTLQSCTDYYNKCVIKVMKSALCAPPPSFIDQTAPLVWYCGVVVLHVNLKLRDILDQYAVIWLQLQLHKYKYIPATMFSMYIYQYICFKDAINIFHDPFFALSSYPVQVGLSSPQSCSIPGVYSQLTTYRAFTIQ